MTAKTFKTAVTSACAAVLAVTFAAEALAVEWNVSLWGKRRAFTENTEKLADLVKQKTGGAFTLNISYGGLSKNRENLDGISVGAFEMAQFCAGYHRDKNPTITVMELPFLGVKNLRQEADIALALYKHPAVVKDLGRWGAVPLMSSPMPQYNMAGVGPAPKSLSDLKGLRVRALGGIGKAMEKLGAIPTSMTATEVYNALESGVVDSVTFAPHAHVAFRVTDIAEWWTTNLDPGTVNCPVVVNKDALDALSPAHRKALLGSVDEAMDYYIENYTKNAQAKLDAKIMERGMTKVTFADAELFKARSIIAGPARDEWIKSMNAKGLPAQALYDLVRGMVDK
ncbi:MAG: C4-dicarboxylate TRAP transporter substrate-binding protein [Rhodospirillales bacterium]